MKDLKYLFSGILIACTLVWLGYYASMHEPRAAMTFCTPCECVTLADREILFADGSKAVYGSKEKALVVLASLSRNCPD